MQGEEMMTTTGENWPTGDGGVDGGAAFQEQESMPRATVRFTQQQADAFNHRGTGSLTR